LAVPLPRAGRIITAVIVADVAALFAVIGVGKLYWAALLYQTRKRRSATLTLMGAGLATITGAFLIWAAAAGLWAFVCSPVGSSG
jgi:hypothetical protein